MPTAHTAASPRRCCRGPAAALLAWSHVTGGRLRYLPAVDGLRAVAVSAVVAFHLWPGALPGGFLGVDTFFVVSGYLITSLLLAEHDGAGRISLRGFWARRARRLLPALLLLLAVVAAGVAAWWPAEDLARVRADGFAGLLYVANWRFVASGESYFDLVSGPSPLRHLWSLAIEEQFYVVWPLVAVACLRRPRGHRWLAAVCVAVAVASVAALVLHGPGDRAYFGTDARAHALVAGALLAVALRPGRTGRHAAEAPAPRWLGAAGTAALAACAAAWWVAGESSAWLFRWGFPAYAALAAVVVLAVVRAPGSRLGRALSAAPLVAVGKVSYGLYLWHWPAVVLLTPSRTGLDGAALDALRLGVTVVGTVASYVLVERPIRFGQVLRGRPAHLATGGAFAGVAAAVLLATTGAAPVPDYLRAPTDRGGLSAEVEVAEPGPGEGSGGATAGGGEAAPGGDGVARGGDGPAAPGGGAPAGGEQAGGAGGFDAGGAAVEPRRPTSVLLVGDSVAWTFQDELGAELAERGVRFAAATIVGCGAAVGADQRLGVVARPDGRPHPWSYDCTDAVNRVQAEGLAAVQPDLVLFHSSWETSDRLVGDRFVRFGTPEWEAVVRRELAAATARLTAGGARMAILTVPPAVDGDLQPADAEGNRRKARYDRLLRSIVAADPQRLLLVDLAELVCAGDVRRCPAEVGGIRLRPLDGIHFEDEGARWVAAKLASVVTSLDLDAPNRSRAAAR